MTDALKKRPWFQFHLSTLMLLVFVAAGLLWCNLQVYKIHIDSGVYANRACGWPLPAVVWSQYSYASRVESQQIIEIVNGTQIVSSPELDTSKHTFVGLFPDLLVALAILFVVAISLEWRIRRRERRT